jgi:hypothetical protein
VQLTTLPLLAKTKKNCGDSGSRNSMQQRQDRSLIQRYKDQATSSVRVEKKEETFSEKIGEFRQPTNFGLHHCHLMRFVEAAN